MIPLLKVANTPRTAEDKLENVSMLMSYLELYVSALSRMSYDEMPSDEFNAIINHLHMQVHEINKQISRNENNLNSKSKNAPS